MWRHGAIVWLIMYVVALAWLRHQIMWFMSRCYITCRRHSMVHNTHVRQWLGLWRHTFRHALSTVCCRNRFVALLYVDVNVYLFNWSAGVLYTPMPLSQLCWCHYCFCLCTESANITVNRCTCNNDNKYYKANTTCGKSVDMYVHVGTCSSDEFC